jgi:hypothetical protein
MTGSGERPAVRDDAIEGGVAERPAVWEDVSEEGVAERPAVCEDASEEVVRVAQRPAVCDDATLSSRATVASRVDALSCFGRLISLAWSFVDSLVSGTRDGKPDMVGCAGRKRRLGVCDGSCEKEDC